MAEPAAINFDLLQAEIEEKGITQDILPEFSSIPIKRYITARPHGSLDDLVMRLGRLDALAEVQLDRPEPSFLKRLLRKFMRFYIKPAVVDQNTVNRYLVDVTTHIAWLAEEYNEVVEILAHQQAENERLQQAVADCRRKYALLELEKEVRE